MNAWLSVCGSTVLSLRKSVGTSLIIIVVIRIEEIRRSEGGKSFAFLIRREVIVRDKGFWRFEGGKIFVFLSHRVVTVREEGF